MPCRDGTVGGGDPAAGSIVRSHQGHQRQTASSDSVVCPHQHQSGVISRTRQGICQLRARSAKLYPKKVIQAQLQALTKAVQETLAKIFLLYGLPKLDCLACIVIRVGLTPIPLPPSFPSLNAHSTNDVAALLAPRKPCLLFPGAVAILNIRGDFSFTCA